MWSCSCSVTDSWYCFERLGGIDMVGYPRMDLVFGLSRYMYIKPHVRLMASLCPYLYIGPIVGWLICPDQ